MAPSPLDQRTLFIVMAALAFGLAISAALVWRATPGVRGLGRIALGHWLFGAGLLVLAGRGLVPLLVLSSLGMPLFILGFALLLEGVRLFYGLEPTRWITLLAVGGAAVFYTAQAIEARPPAIGDVTLQFIVGNGLLAGLFGAAAWTVFTGFRAHGEGAAGCLTGVSFLLASMSRFALVVLALAGLPVGAYWRGAGGDHVTPYLLVVLILSSLGWSIGLVTCVNRRLMRSADGARRELASREERYRRVVEASPDIIYRTDPLGHFNYVNPAAQRLMGYSVEETLGLRFLELIRPDCRQEAMRFYARQSRERIDNTQYEFPAIAKDGREVWLSQSVQLLAVGEEITGFEAVAHEITGRKRAEAELLAQKELLERLVTIARATAEGPDLHAALRNTATICGQLTGAMGASLFLLGEDGTVVRAIRTDPGAMFLDHREAERFLKEGFAGWVVREGRSAVIPDTLTDPRWLTMAGRDWRSVLAVPISTGGAAVGVLTLTHDQPGHFQAGHVRLMEEAAVQMALSLKNAQVSEARLELAEAQRLLYDVLRAASQHLDPDAIAEAAAEACAIGIGWHHCSIGIPGEDGCWRFHKEQDHVAEGRIPIGAGVAGRAFATGESQVVADVSVDPDYLALSPDTRSELAVAIRHRGQSLGVLNIESPHVAAFGPGEVRLAESVADAIALGLENARLYKAVAAQTARLAAVIRSHRDGLVLVEGSGRLLLVNAHALRLLGLADGDEGHAERTFESLLVPFGPVASKALREAATGSNGAAREGECVLGFGHVQWTTVPVPAVGRLLVLHDVTREREVEQMREDMTRTMVHDLRSPLTAIRGAVGLVGAMRELAPEQRELLQVAESNAQRQLLLIESILDVSRLEQGAMPLERSAFSLATLVGEVLRLAGPRAASDGIELVSTVPGELPRVLADRPLIGRVLDNLVSNAIKFTLPGGIVRVAADRTDGGVRVSVSDTGSGVPAEVRPRLFQKFVAGHQKGRGSGLGLAFCRLAVQAHGGRIWLEQENGTGATLVFTLTAAERPAAA